MTELLEMRRREESHRAETVTARGADTAVGSTVGRVVPPAEDSARRAGTVSAENAITNLSRPGGAIGPVSGGFETTGGFQDFPQSRGTAWCTTGMSAWTVSPT